MDIFFHSEMKKNEANRDVVLPKNDKNSMDRGNEEVFRKN